MTSYGPTTRALQSSFRKGWEGVCGQKSLFCQSLRPLFCCVPPMDRQSHIENYSRRTVFGELRIAACFRNGKSSVHHNFQSQSGIAWPWLPQRAFYGVRGGICNGKLQRTRDLGTTLVNLTLPVPVLVSSNLAPTFDVAHVYMGETEKLTTLRNQLPILKRASILGRSV